MSNNNSPEYCTIIQCTPELTTALKDDLLPLTGELLAAGLIVSDSAAAFTNQFTGKAHRVAQLMESVRNRVSLDTKNYLYFVRVLMQRQGDHKNILEILDEKYKKLGGQLETGISSSGNLASTDCTPSDATPTTPSDAKTTGIKESISEPAPSDIDSKPALAKLLVLRTPKGKIKITSRIAPYWRKLGFLMNFDDNGAEIITIEKKHHSDPEECCQTMFQHWINGNGVKPCSWRKLIELLSDCDQEALAQEIQSAFLS